MNVLIVTSSLPYPPTSGGAIRTHGIVEGLHRAGHTVTVLCFDTGNTPLPDHLRVVTVPPPPPRPKLDRLRDLLFTQTADIAKRLYDARMAATLRDLLAENPVDLVQFEGIEMACYLPVAKQANTHTKLSFDTFNAEYALQRSIFRIDARTPRRWPAAIYSWLQIGRIRRYESHICEMADLVFAVSEEDAVLLRPLRADGHIHVVNSGIWVDRYADHTEPIPTDSPALVFTGSMDYRPNVDAMLWFTEAIYPQVRAAVPDVHLFIVGKDPHPRLEPLRTLPGVTLTGRVPAVTPYLQAADLFVVPLRMGSGTRLKLLEAMASECAIVATTAASAGLNDAVKATMYITDGAEEMADAIIDLLADPGKRHTLRTQTRQRVAEHYDWSVLIPQMLAAYHSIGLR